MEKYIKIYDNVFSYQENMGIYNNIIRRPFYYGERDNPHQPPTGMVNNIHNNDPLLNKLHSIVINCNKEIENKKLSRAYINLFLPKEKPYFHIDGDVITCLFYINPITEIDDNGETQFIVNEEIYGIFPKPSRLVIFDGNIKHRATSFFNQPRISIALKYI